MTGWRKQDGFSRCLFALQVQAGVRMKTVELGYIQSVPGIVCMLVTFGGQGICSLCVRFILGSSRKSAGGDAVQGMNCRNYTFHFVRGVV